MAEPIEVRLARAGLPPLARRCWLEIDEEALADNLRLVRAFVGDGVEVNAVVKADAYGHGNPAVARVFETAGATRLCVASLDEALHLRASGIRAPILVLFAIPAEHTLLAAQAGLELVLADEQSATALLEHWTSAAPSDATLNVHLEVETGLARAGLRPERVAAMAARLADVGGIRLAGIWSHLASPDDGAMTAAQVSQFERAVDSLRESGLGVPARHLAATGGLLTGRAPVYEGVRPGLMLYGLLPLNLPLNERARPLARGLRPAMTLKCRPLRVEDVAPGTPVGYGGRWVAARRARIATLPVGYGDGWSRAYAPNAWALVRGQRVPLVGTIAMDAIVADVTDVPGVGPGDEFVLLGAQGDERVGAEDLARAGNTIPWEVVTTMAQRIPRVYHARAVLLGVRTLAGEIRVADGRTTGGGGPRP